MHGRNCAMRSNMAAHSNRHCMTKYAATVLACLSVGFRGHTSRFTPLLSHCAEIRDMAKKADEDKRNKERAASAIFKIEDQVGWLERF